MDLLSNLRLDYEIESDLRKRASYRTPDILLRVPVAFDGAVVTWIDSKAKFADKTVLQKDYTDSVSAYASRFGPGMVIYWFGFVSDCDCPMLNDSSIMVVDDFPKSMTTLPGSVPPPLGPLRVEIVDE